jgi:hypothetical protein
MKEYQIQIKPHNDSKWVNAFQTQSIFYARELYAQYAINKTNVFMPGFESIRLVHCYKGGITVLEEA